MVKYYKVVTNIGGRLFPLVHSCIGVEYESNKWTKPLEGTQLICLDSFMEAEIWKNMYGGEIWECDIIKTKSVHIFLGYGNAVTINVIRFIETIQKLKKAKKKFTHLTKNYNNYIFCDAIKLLRKIK